MATFSPSERERIRAAVEAAERRTAGELVTVIARQADDYWFIPTLAAAVAALGLSALWVLLPLPWQPSLVEFSSAQLALFLVVALLARIPSVRMALVPRAVKRRRASLAAHAAFLDLGLHRSPHRGGVLLFVSFAERYVEILADTGVQDRLPGNEPWERIVASFTEEVRRGRVAEGFASAIEGAAAVMAEALPPDPAAPRVLPDHLIEI